MTHAIFKCNTADLRTCELRLTTDNTSEIISRPSPDLTVTLIEPPLVVVHAACDKKLRTSQQIRLVRVISSSFLLCFTSWRRWVIVWHAATETSQPSCWRGVIVWSLAYSLTWKCLYIYWQSSSSQCSDLHSSHKLGNPGISITGVLHLLVVSLSFPRHEVHWHNA